MISEKIEVKKIMQRIKQKNQEKKSKTKKDLTATD